MNKLLRFFLSFTGWTGQHQEAIYLACRPISDSV